MILFTISSPQDPVTGPGVPIRATHSNEKWDPLNTMKNRKVHQGRSKADQLLPLSGQFLLNSRESLG